MHQTVTRRALLGGGLGLGLGIARATPALERPALKMARPTQAVLLAITRAGPRRLVACGERGLVIVSDDGGRSWAQAAVPVSATLTALRFADERRGWAVGNLGVVLETADGGASWIRRLDGVSAARLALAAGLEDGQRLVDEGPDKPFLDVALRRDGSVFAAGAYGLAFASAGRDGRWAPQAGLPNPEGLSYYGLVERQGGGRDVDAYLFGEQGLLLRAGAGDAAFQPQASPASGSLFAGLALREGPLLLMGLRGRVYRSGARDEAWSAIPTPVEASLLAGHQLQDGGVLLAGAAGQLLLSRDGGQRLQPLRGELPARFPFAGIAQAHDGGVLLVGLRGLVRMDSLPTS